MISAIIAAIVIVTIGTAAGVWLTSRLLPLSLDEGGEK